MSQLNLFPPDQARQPTRYDLFLAIFPNKFAAHDIYGFGMELRGKQRLVGKLRPLYHLHVSVPCLIDVSAGLDRAIQLVDRACRTIADTTPPFEVTFDRVLSFGGPPAKHALVLAGSKDGNVELKTFHRLLAAKLSNGRNVNPKFTPHMTLLYDRQISEEAISPLRWEVKEVVLVLSHVGKTKYERLGHWELGGRSN